MRLDGSSVASTSATSGAAAAAYIAACRSTESASAPRPTARDPAEADREPDREAGRHPDPGRQVLLRHHHRHAEGRDHADADERQRDRAWHAADHHVDDDQRRGRRQARDQHRPPPEPVGQRPGDQRADAAREQHQREQVRAVGLRVAERDLPERHEGDQPEPGDAAEGDHAEQQRERARPVLPARGRAAARLGHEAPQERRHEQQQDGHGQHRQREQQAAGEAEREDQRRRRGRPQRVADVAADREEAHPARPLGTAGVGGELRALGVVCSDAEPRDDDEQQHEPVGGRGSGERDPDARQRDAGRQQPERAAPVRPGAEERLHERRGSRRGEHHDRGERVREPEAVDHEGQQRGQRAVREVRRAVPRREHRHRPFVELGAHGPSLAAEKPQPDQRSRRWRARAGTRASLP